MREESASLQSPPRQEAPEEPIEDLTLLIFSDLDGTLLDSGDRLPACNRVMLQKLEKMGIPVVFTSSKTRHEILHLQQQLCMHQPFIPENGGGVYMPSDHPLTDQLTLMPWGDGWGMHFGVPYSYVRAILMHLSPEFDLQGMADMSEEELVRRTGLSAPALNRALNREFSEPFIFLSQPRMDALRLRLESFGLTLTRGGEFFHMMSATQDKGRAVAKAIQLFKAAYSSPPLTVALGDAENDSSMFSVVDRAIQIRRKDGSLAEINAPNVHPATKAGCEGWSEELEQVITEIHENRQPGKASDE